MSLACLLHPTPALSGFPHQVAKRLIAELEPFDRQLLAALSAGAMTKATANGW